MGNIPFSKPPLGYEPTETQILQGVLGNQLALIKNDLTRDLAA